MIQLSLDKLYWFTKMGLRSIVPVRTRAGSMVFVVGIPKNSYGVPSGFYVAESSRVGPLVPTEGPYRTRTIAVVAAVT